MPETWIGEMTRGKILVDRIMALLPDARREWTQPFREPWPTERIIIPGTYELAMRAHFKRNALPRPPLVSTW